jgi:TPR repeat protein
MQVLGAIVCQTGFCLGEMYADGEGVPLNLGVPRNPVQAQVWYRKAADQGYGLAKVALSRS